MKKIGLGFFLAMSGWCLCAKADVGQDPELFGKWEYAFLTYANDSMMLFPDGQMKQYSVLGGHLYVDAEATFEVDTSTEPRRIIETVTKVNPSQVVKFQPGDKFYCVYKIHHKTTLEMNCSDANVTKFPDDYESSFAYSKIEK